MRGREIRLRSVRRHRTVMLWQPRLSTEKLECVSRYWSASCRRRRGQASRPEPPRSRAPR